MKKFMVVIGVVLLIVVAIAFARPPKADYQWTGTVLEADGDHLVVEKGMVFFLNGAKYSLTIFKAHLRID